MTGCAAPNCYNSLSKKYKMCYFPLKDPERCAIWITNTGRKNWTPTRHSALCQVHFDRESWEQHRKDGLLKLKNNAVPTIFDHSGPSTCEDIISDVPTTIKVTPFMIQDKTSSDAGGSGSQNVISPLESEIEVEQFTSDDSENNAFDMNSEETISEDDKSFITQQKLLVNTKDLNRCNCTERVDKILKYCTKCDRLRKITKKKLHDAKLQIKRLKKRVRMLEKSSNNFETVFNEDQRKVVVGEYKKVPAWSNSTLCKAFKYKFICGTTGYEEIARDLSLPCLRTLRRRLEFMKFENGVWDESFEFLSIKISTFKSELDKHCAIVLDEMNITPIQTFDPSTNSGEKNVATHGLVIMLVGIGSRWKKIVAYYFTGQSVDGSLLKPIVCDIIQKAEDIGLFVHSITSDMGSTNLGLWKAFGITASRYGKTINSCSHPHKKGRKRFFFHDSAHAFKNLKQGLLKNNHITISDEFIRKYQLPTNTVQASHLRDLCSMQENTLDFGLALAPKLKSNLLNSNNHFSKMKVSNATNVISLEVSSALQLVAKDTNNPDFITTAWFIGFVCKWFKIMSTRNPKGALGKMSTDKFEKTISFLKEFIELISSMKVGASEHWKPFQAGIVISTQSMIELTGYLLDHEGFKFVLGSRFMQDSVENLFSIIRSKHVIPNASQFKNDLKLITVSFYMKSVSHSSYDQDDREFSAEFSETLTKKKLECKKAGAVTEQRRNEVDIDICVDDTEFNYVTLNCLFYVGGYVISKIVKKYEVCDICISAVGSKEQTVFPHTELTRARCFDSESLFFINEEAFAFFIKMEEIFRAYFTKTCGMSIDLITLVVQKCQSLDYSIPACHNLRDKIIRQFITFRCKKMSLIYAADRHAYSSKSAAMHAFIK